jgi:hypothetical protein
MPALRPSKGLRYDYAVVMQVFTSANQASEGLHVRTHFVGESTVS